ncbi:MAG: hypothetical protein IKL33_01730 [Alphaproteobacteria bacterium]|nr:hypothetical protein [Alphaproteobacteria bacterium]
MHKILFLFVFLGLLSATNAYAVSMADYQKTFEIDLENDQLPSQEELLKIFFQENRYYDKKYNTVWDLLGNFDADFYSKLTTYGINEKRLKWEEEDMVLEIINSFPKEMYPYIGPMLFKVPNMSEKVLNLPGIKETKNKFPDRIADELKDIEEIEFLSPFFYYILMPEMWPDNMEKIETPQNTKYYPKVVYNPDFYAMIKKIVPPEDFMPNAKEKTLGKSDLRTIKPDRKNLLTAADVAAIARTLPEVEKWYRERDNHYQMNAISTILWSYEYSKDPTVVAGMREIVNPCARFVQKAKLVGKERSLAKRVAKEGFTLNEWAYTCDKTIKAYRLSRINKNLVQALRMYKQGIWNHEIDKLSLQNRATRYSTMQALVSAYSAPLSDVVEVRKKRQLLEDSLDMSNYRIGDVKIRIE